MSESADHGSADKQIERAIKQYDRLQSFFPRIEARAAFLFALDIALAGITAANLPGVGCARPALAVAAVLAASLALGILFALLVFTTHLANPSRKSLLYFGDIAAMAAADYQEADAKETADQFLDDLRRQNWRNAQILTHKYRWAGLSFRATAAAIPLWLLFLIMNAYLTGHAPVWKPG